VQLDDEPVDELGPQPPQILARIQQACHGLGLDGVAEHRQAAQETLGGRLKTGAGPLEHLALDAGEQVRRHLAVPRLPCLVRQSEQVVCSRSRMTSKPKAARGRRTRAFSASTGNFPID